MNGQGCEVIAARPRRSPARDSEIRQGSSRDEPSLSDRVDVGRHVARRRTGLPGKLTGVMGDYGRKIRLPTTRLHDLSHSAATWKLKDGVDLATIAAVLGHASGIVTLGTYAHVLKGAKGAAVATIDARLARLEQTGVGS